MIGVGVRMKRVSLALAALSGATALAGCGETPDVAVGPACVPVDQAAFAAHPYKPNPKLHFEYRDVVFSRALGNGDCRDVSSGGLGFKKHGVCDLTGPVILDVQTPDGKHAYYTPGNGQPVRVIIRDGAAKCELPKRG